MKETQILNNIFFSSTNGLQYVNHFCLNKLKIITNKKFLISLDLEDIRVG